MAIVKLVAAANETGQWKKTNLFLKWVVWLAVVK